MTLSVLRWIGVRAKPSWIPPLNRLEFFPKPPRNTTTMPYPWLHRFYVGMREEWAKIYIHSSFNLPNFSLVPNSRAAGWWTGDWAVEIRRYCGIHSSFNLPSKDRNSDQTVWSICIGVSIASKDRKSDQIFKQVGIFNSWFTTRASRRTRHLLPK